jgi:diguanylate cyclase (GGDEF)-like protein
VSPVLHSVVTAAGGILSGLALAGGLLWRQQRALTDARYQANHDPLTGLPNRRAALGRLHQALRTGQPLGLILLDLDTFKTINDTFGHTAGDDVLIDIAQRLAAMPAPVVLAARLAGDEFALVVHGDTDAIRATAHAASRAINGTPVPLGTELIPVRASVGYARARTGITVGQLLSEADEAMYRAKSSDVGVCGHRRTATDHDPPPPPRRRRDRHHP